MQALAGHGRRLSVLALGAFGAAATLFGGGARIPDQAARAMGMGDAFVAGADDASAVYYNPAGLTLLAGPQAIGDLYLAHAWVECEGPGGDDRSDGRYYLLPIGYFGAPVGPDGTAAGLGLYAPFGLGSKWGDGTASRWAMAQAPGASATKLSELRMVCLSPVLAQKLGDHLAIGIGPNLYYSEVISRSQTNYGLGVGETDLDASGTGWGANAGLQWQCTDQVTLGLVYRSAFTIHYEGDIQYDGLPPALFGVRHQSYDAEVDLTFPASLGAGVCWQPAPRLRFELAGEWMDWSRWDQRTATVAGTPFGPGTRNLTSRLDWEDSWILSLGSEYEVSGKWTLRAGLIYNQTCVPGDTADVDLPTGDTYAVALGASYRVSAALSVDLALTTAYGLERSLDHSSAPAGSRFDALSAYAAAGVTYGF
jgi:long-chain fatty acid transport protein